MINQQQMFALANSAPEQIAPGAVLLRSYFTHSQAEVLQAIRCIETVSPFRHMVTPGGFRMSVAMTNSGQVGWASDRKGYRYSSIDPLNDKPWPPLPRLLLELARQSADAAGHADFQPDVCLINRYEAGAKMSLHQDKDEKDFKQPIVSFSLGLPATFQFGGMKRTDRPVRVRLLSGDAIVWGGPSRLAYHGVSPIAKGLEEHPLTGPYRFNLTFRLAV